MRVHDGAHGACCVLRQLTVSLPHTPLSFPCAFLLTVSLYLSRTSLYNNPGIRPRSGEVTAATHTHTHIHTRPYEEDKERERPMQVLHSLHVPPYPDPYPSLTESPISPPTSQPPARSLTCMRPGFLPATPSSRSSSPSRPPRTTLPWFPLSLTCQRRRRQPDQVWWWRSALCGGVESDVEEISMPTSHNLRPHQPYQAGLASHRVGTFYIIILFLFWFLFYVIQVLLT